MRNLRSSALSLVS